MRIGPAEILVVIGALLFFLFGAVSRYERPGTGRMPAPRFFIGLSILLVMFLLGMRLNA